MFGLRKNSLSRNNAAGRQSRKLSMDQLEGRELLTAVGVNHAPTPDTQPTSPPAPMQFDVSQMFNNVRDNVNGLQKSLNGSNQQKDQDVANKKAEEKKEVANQAASIENLLSQALSQLRSGGAGSGGQSQGGTSNGAASRTGV